MSCRSNYTSSVDVGFPTSSCHQTHLMLRTHALLLPADTNYCTTFQLFSEHIAICYIQIFQMLTYKSRAPVAIVLQLSSYVFVHRLALFPCWRYGFLAATFPLRPRLTRQKIGCPVAEHLLILKGNRLDVFFSSTTLSFFGRPLRPRSSALLVFFLWG